jgi:lysophospholipid acyltransferase (LPLAT)-like uncharacterized protein
LAKRRGSTWIDRLVFWLGPWLIRLHTRTLRIRVEQDAELERLLARGQPVVLAGWHQRIYLGIRPAAPLRPFIMISQSRDGERIARIVEKVGWRPVRGSSSRGGVGALAALIREVSKGAVAAHVVDGPRGPARRVKPGLALLARRSGAVVIPAYLSARRRFQARSWDRFIVPYPFTRVVLRWGPALEPAAEGTDEADAEFCRRVEQSLERGHAELDRELGHDDRSDDAG